MLIMHRGKVLDVTLNIQSGEAGWEKLVPPEIVEVIKGERLFGFGTEQKAEGPESVKA